MSFKEAKNAGQDLLRFRHRPLDVPKQLCYSSLAVVPRDVEGRLAGQGGDFLFEPVARCDDRGDARKVRTRGADPGESAGGLPSEGRHDHRDGSLGLAALGGAARVHDRGDREGGVRLQRLPGRVISNPAS